MSRSNSWIFGLIFLLIFIYVGWNGFEFPKIIIGKMNTTSGKVVKIYPNYGPRGGYYQRIKYVYAVNFKHYSDYKNIGEKFGQQEIGDRIEIEYLVKKPENNKVMGFYDDFKTSNKKKYYSSKKKGYFEILLNNGIFNLKEYADRGIIINEFIGDYKISNDTIKFEYYHFEADSLNNIVKPESFVIDSISNCKLIDNKTKRIFKKITM